MLRYAIKYVDPEDRMRLRLVDKETRRLVDAEHPEIYVKILYERGKLLLEQGEEEIEIGESIRRAFYTVSQGGVTKYVHQDNIGEILKGLMAKGAILRL